MTLLWGAFESSGGVGLRVGIDSTHTTVTGSSTTCVFTYYIYTQNSGSYDDNQTLNYGGVGSGAFNFTNNDSGSAILRDTNTYTYTYGAGSYGTSPGTVTYTATISGAFNGVTPTGSRTDTIPARPYALPAPPTAVTATRNTDAQITLAWTPHATTGAPYTSQTVQMRTFTGSVWGSWVTLATASAAATGYVATGLSANNVYDFQVRSNNTTGSSAYAGSNEVAMTPAAPSSVTSSVGSAGTSVTTTWSDNAYIYSTSPITFTVQRSVAGGAFANVITGLAQSIHTWTDPAPGGGTNQYRVAAVQPIGSLSSAYGTGNTVSTIVAPLAPTNLAPNGVNVDFLHTNVVLTWKHNHGGDGAPQTHFTIETSANNGSSWQALATNIASSTQSYTVTAGTRLNGVPYLWHVRTEGVTSVGFGPYSAAAATTGSSTPTVTLSLPAGTTTSLPLRAVWAYNQDESSPQANWEATLYAGNGTTILEQQTGSGTTSSVSFVYPLVDGTTYVVKVRAQSGTGVWSALAVAATDFNLLPPAAAIVTPEYRECTGTMILHITAGAAVPGVTVDVESVTLERRVAGGDWVTLGVGLVPPIDFLDNLPLTNGLNEYRATSVSASPSYNTGMIVAAYGTDGLLGSGLWTFLSYGDSFGTTLRFHGAPSISQTSGRLKEAKSFLGRPRPVLLMGINTTNAISVGGSLWYDASGACPPDDPDGCLFDSSPSQWTTAGLAAEMVCLRDYTGRRMFGMLSDVQVSEKTWQPGTADVSFSVTEVDFTELYVVFISGV